MVPFIGDQSAFTNDVARTLKVPPIVSPAICDSYRIPTPALSGQHLWRGTNRRPSVDTIKILVWLDPVRRFNILPEYSVLLFVCHALFL